MKVIFQGIAWVLGLFIATALAAAVDGRIGAGLSGLAIVASLVLLIRPRPAYGLERRWVAIPVALLSAITLSASLGVFKQQEKKEQLSLRERDPKAYLVSIRGKVEDAAYLDELKALDPKGHEAELAAREAERREKERQVEEARAKEKADIVARLAGTLTLPDEQAARLRLAELDPAHADNTARLAAVTEQLRQITAREEAERQRVELEKRARNNPEEFLDLVDFDWHKGGFGVVMMATFKVRNRSPFDIKDIGFRCEHSAASGTRIDHSSQIVYDLVKAGATRSFSKVNMGFVHNQARSSACRIVSAKAMEPKPPAAPPPKAAPKPRN